MFCDTTKTGKVRNELYRSLNAIVVQLKNCPFGVNTTTELKTVATHKVQLQSVLSKYNSEILKWRHCTYIFFWSFLRHSLSDFCHCCIRSTICHYDLYSQTVRLKQAMGKRTLFCSNAAFRILHKDLRAFIVAGEINLPQNLCCARLSICI